MRGYRKFIQRGSNFDNVFFCVSVCFSFVFLFLVDEERKDKNIKIPLLASVQ